jgi:hypothetical protein
VRFIPYAVALTVIKMGTRNGSEIIDASSF